MNYQLLLRTLIFNLRWPILLVACTLICSSGCKPKGDGSDSGGNDEPLQGPATLEQAARILDLTTFPLMDGAAANPNRALASLTYTMPNSNVKSAFEFQRKKLTALRWKQSSRDTSVTDQSASSTFVRNGFVLSVAAYPSGDDRSITVSLNNRGNINYSKLPRPGATKPLYVGDSSALYLTDAAVSGTAAECRKLLLADGWAPYGSAADSAWFKENAIRLGVTVSSAPAQGGKTVISFSSELMSADLPAPEQADELRYADMTKELSFETAASKDTVVEFYKRTLGQTRWEPTLDKTVEVDENPTMIFRNPAKDMLTLTFSSQRNNKTPVSLKHQSAAEIAELERQIKAKAPEIKAEMERQQAKEAAQFAEAHKPLPKVGVAVPGDANDVEQTASEIKFTVAKGKAKPIAETWRKQFRDAGWKENVAVTEAMAGGISLSKDRQSVTIHYTDTGFTPAEVTISAMGVELEPSAK